MIDTLDPRLTPARPHIADVNLRDSVQAEHYAAGVSYRVILPSAPLRRTPSDEGALETEVVLGDAVTVYAVEGNYAFAQLVRDRYVGYLPRFCLGPIDPEPTHRVVALRTFLYPSPDLKSPPSGHLSLGSRLIVDRSAGDYFETPGGYVFAGHCSSIDSNIPDYVGTAERLIGVPYLWGGRTSLGLDCSGLSQLCLDLANIPCLRDADMQEQTLGEALPLSVAGLRRGDFVFWRGHMGLMRDATTLIHANGHHMAVAVEPLEEAVARISANSYGPVTSLRRL